MLPSIDSVVRACRVECDAHRIMNTKHPAMRETRLLTVLALRELRRMSYPEIATALGYGWHSVVKDLHDEATENSAYAVKLERVKQSMGVIE